MFVMVDYVRGMTVKKSCKHGEYGLFEDLLFLFLLLLLLLWLLVNSLSTSSPYFVPILHRNGLLCVSVTRGVTVSTSAFLACHQCYCAGSSLAWGLNLRAVVCGIF